jgi:indolepyruvate ferredoxin oxidoreductase
MERRLIDEYERTVEELLEALATTNHALAVSVAALPQGIRGFGPVKLRNVQAARQRQAELMQRFRGATSCPSFPSTTVTAKSGSTAA